VFVQGERINSNVQLQSVSLRLQPFGGTGVSPAVSLNTLIAADLSGGGQPSSGVVFDVTGSFSAAGVTLSGFMLGASATVFCRVLSSLRAVLDACIFWIWH
jgi:hypothetical protein